MEHVSQSGFSHISHRAEISGVAAVIQVESRLWQQALARIHELAAADLSARKISADLPAQGIKLSHVSVLNVLQREALAEARCQLSSFGDSNAGSLAVEPFPGALPP